MRRVFGFNSPRVCSSSRIAPWISANDPLSGETTSTVDRGLQLLLFADMNANELVQLPTHARRRAGHLGRGFQTNVCA
jgi:hypothetical protein